METSENAYRNKKEGLPKEFGALPDNELRAIAYSMDALLPGFYLWFGPLKIRIGGTEAEETYPGTIHSFVGMALVLPDYRIYSTYKGSYDP